jgi:hypothetical protein
MIKLVLANCILLLLSLARLVSASAGSVASQFLGSPLLILAALLAIDAVALAYRRFRK